jgi:hypothetical protein
MSYTRVIVEECKPGTIEMLCKKAEQTLMPRLRQIPGFHSYQVAKIDERWLTVVGVCETREALAEMDRMGIEWRQQYGKDAIVSVKTHIGEVLIDVSGPSFESLPAH